MRMKHIMLEGYCSVDVPNKNYACNVHEKKMGIYCLECDLFSYTICPNEIALSNEYGIIESLDDFVSIDLDEEDDKKRCEKVSLWRNICKAKIAEAYDEYMKSTETN